MKLKRFVLASLLTAASIQIWAESPVDTDPSDTDDNSTELKKGAPIENPNRPKSPDRQMIFCQYDGEELTFSFAYSEGLCDVMLTEKSGLTQYYTIDSSELFASIYVGRIGYTTITLTTQRGTTYTGTINRSQQ